MRPWFKLRDRLEGHGPVVLGAACCAGAWCLGWVWLLDDAPLTASELFLIAMGCLLVFNAAAWWGVMVLLGRRMDTLALPSPGAPVGDMGGDMQRMKALVDEALAAAQQLDHVHQGLVTQVRAVKSGALAVQVISKARWAAQALPAPRR